MSRVIAVLLLMLAELLLGQSQREISQSTGGACSPAVVSEGNVTITCAGLDSHQVDVLRKIPGLIDQLLKRRHSDRNEILAKLEEILRLERDAEARQAQRVITRDQHQSIVRMLSKYPTECSVGASINDKEAGVFAQSIGAALRGAGWKISQAMLPPLGFRGIRVVVNPNSEAAGATNLARILEELGLSVEIRSHPGVSTHACEVHIGEK